jgi:hypothetical protein
VTPNPTITKDFADWAYARPRMTYRELADVRYLAANLVADTAAFLIQTAPDGGSIADEDDIEAGRETLTARAMALGALAPDYCDPAPGSKEYRGDRHWPAFLDAEHAATLLAGVDEAVLFHTYMLNDPIEREVGGDVSGLHVACINRMLRAKAVLERIVPSEEKDT